MDTHMLMAAKRATRLAAFALICSAGLTRADYDPSQYPAYETCALCHGLFGVSHTAKFPNLGGQTQVYIEMQIRAFLSGDRTNDGGQMASIVTELHPEDIPFVAEWFAGQDAPAPYPAEDTATGAGLFADIGCGSCHMPGSAPEVPYLTAQHPGYLAKQMTDFREGRRQSQVVPGTHPSILTITDDEIAAIAAYLGAEPRQ